MASSTSTAEPRPRALPRALLPLASLPAMIALWWAAAALIGRPADLPGPLAVLETLRSEAASGALWLHLGATLARTLAAFVVAMAVGSAIGIALGMRRRVDAWAEPWLVVALNLPALVTIVLCYIWIGLTEAAAVTAVAINKIPLVATILREGARALDPGLRDMGAVFGMGRLERLRHVVLPQLAPFFASAARTGLALVWKIVLVVELLGRPNGVGFMIHEAFANFDVAKVLAYALAFVAVILAIETFALRPWQRRAERWREG